MEVQWIQARLDSPYSIYHTTPALVTLKSAIVQNKPQACNVFLRRQQSILNSWIIDCHRKTRLKPCFWKQKSANRYFHSFNFFYFTESPIPKCISTAVVWADAVVLEALNSSQVLLLASQLLYVFFCQCTRIDPWEKTDMLFEGYPKWPFLFAFLKICFVILSRNLSEKIQRSIYSLQKGSIIIWKTESLFSIQKHASWLILAHHSNQLNQRNTPLR